MPKYELFNNEEWSALYVDGKVVEKSVGDSYHADECIRAILGVIEYDASEYDFLLGGSQYKDVAETTTEIFAYVKRRNDERNEAQRLRAQANELIAQAETLEKSR